MCILTSSFANPFAYGELLASPLSIDEPPLSIDESPVAFSAQHFPNHFYLQVEINFIPLSV